MKEQRKKCSNTLLSALNSTFIDLNSKEASKLAINNEEREADDEQSDDFISSNDSISMHPNNKLLNVIPWWDDQISSSSCSSLVATKNAKEPTKPRYCFGNDDEDTDLNTDENELENEDGDNDDEDENCTNEENVLDDVNNDGQEDVEFNNIITGALNLMSKTSQLIYKKKINVIFKLL